MAQEGKPKKKSDGLIFGRIGLQKTLLYLKKETPDLRSTISILIYKSSLTEKEICQP